MKSLSKSQSELLNILRKYMTKLSPMHYDNLKALSQFKTFDSTFNALLFKRYVRRFKLGDGNNTYILN